MAIALAVSLSMPALLAQPAPAARRAPARHAASRRARAAKSVKLNETGHLHLVSKHDFTLNEKGRASGTIKGAIYVHLTAVSSSKVTVTVKIHPPGGSIVGRGRGWYRRKGKMASFAGTMSFGHGTGKYAHAHGSGLRFSGTIYESRSDAITVHVKGRVSS